jgi:hypothetical protein
MLEFNACRHDCELSGGFCAMAIAIVSRAAMCQKGMFYPERGGRRFGGIGRRKTTDIAIS